MNVEKSGCIAVVDPSNEFLFLEDALQTSLSPYPVIGFDDTKQFMETFLDRQTQMPYSWLVLIADYEARSPNIEEGVFSLVSDKVSDFYGVAFTTQPGEPAWKNLLSQKLIANEQHIIYRLDPNAILVIFNVIQRIVNNLGGYADFTKSKARRRQLLSKTRHKSLKEVVTKNDSGTGTSNAKQGEPSIIAGRDNDIAATDIVPKVEPLRPTETTNLNKQQMDSKQPEKVLRQDDLIESGTYLSWLLYKNTLNFYQRFLVREVAWDLFTKLARDNVEHLEKYRKFIKSDACPKDKEGWQIFGHVLTKSQTAQENHLDKGSETCKTN